MHLYLQMVTNFHLWTSSRFLRLEISWVFLVLLPLSLPRLLFVHGLSFSGQFACICSICSCTKVHARHLVFVPCFVLKVFLQAKVLPFHVESTSFNVFCDGILFYNNIGKRKEFLLEANYCKESDYWVDSDVVEHISRFSITSSMLNFFTHHR